MIMTDTTQDTAHRKAKKPKGPKYVPQGAVPIEYRRKLYAMVMLGGLLFFNPLVLYRFPGISDGLYLQQWFGFANLWQNNDVGGSVLELIVWCAAFLPGYDSIFGMNLAPQAKWIIGIVVGIACFWYTYRVGYNIWLARRAFNSWVLFIQPLKKAALIGGPVAVVMLLLNWLLG